VIGTHWSDRPRSGQNLGVVPKPEFAQEMNADPDSSIPVLQNRIAQRNHLARGLCNNAHQQICARMFFKENLHLLPVEKFT
jgi:hypothetical protein